MTPNERKKFMGDGEEAEAIRKQMKLAEMAEDDDDDEDSDNNDDEEQEQS